MSIREIARSLYELKKQVEEKERAVEAEPPGEGRERLQRELAKARAEYERVRKILEGAKDEPPPARRP
jgi:hypothetical protein